jgi:hypothetical protein
MIRKSGCADPINSELHEDSENFQINTSRRRNYTTSVVANNRESTSILKNAKITSNKKQPTLTSTHKISNLENLSLGQQTPIFEDREKFSLIAEKSGFPNRDASNITGVGLLEEPGSGKVSKKTVNFRPLAPRQSITAVGEDRGKFIEADQRGEGAGAGDNIF